ncbi:protein of unknown function [Burkholderia multivorans]
MYTSQELPWSFSVLAGLPTSEMTVIREVCPTTNLSRLTGLGRFASIMGAHPLKLTTRTANPSAYFLYICFPYEVCFCQKRFIDNRGQFFNPSRAIRCFCRGSLFFRRPSVPSHADASPVCQD